LEKRAIEFRINKAADSSREKTGILWKTIGILKIFGARKIR